MTLAGVPASKNEDEMLKGLALWWLGVPLFVIILLYIFVF